MPELPEVETIRAGLAQHLPGEVISRVKVLRPESIGYPSPQAFARSLCGLGVDTVSRKGKYLILHLQRKDRLIVHLGMSGRLLLVDQADPVSRHLRVSLLLQSGRELRFEDMRVFGRLWYVPRNLSLEQIIPGLHTIGREPISETTTAYLRQTFKSRTRPIKSALLDQRIISGIGNIYADESLYLAGIHPCIPVNRLTARHLRRLIKAISAVLSRAIELGGSTIKDYKNSQGVNGNYQGEALVYGRWKEPCRRCRTPIQRLRLSGRSTHFCPRCQVLATAAEEEGSG